MRLGIFSREFHIYQTCTMMLIASKFIIVKNGNQCDINLKNKLGYNQ